MLHLEMITKRVQEIEKLNKKVRDEILEKKLEEIFTRLQKLEEVLSNENEEKKEERRKTNK